MLAPQEQTRNKTTNRTSRTSSSRSSNRRMKTALRPRFPICPPISDCLKASENTWWLSGRPISFARYAHPAIKHVPCCFLAKGPSTEAEASHWLSCISSLGCLGVRTALDGSFCLFLLRGICCFC